MAQTQEEKRISSTRQQRNLAREKRIWIQSLKIVPCMDCGVTYWGKPYVYDFDHREGGKKELMISKVGQHGWEALKREVAKCDIVCANCHRIRTHQRKLNASLS